jgi:hypothetical protein
MDPLMLHLGVSTTIDTPKASIEMPKARASDLAMHVVTVGTRAKPPRRETAELREVGALREQAISSSRSLRTAGMRVCPYTLLCTVHAKPDAAA